MTVTITEVRVRLVEYFSVRDHINTAVNIGVWKVVVRPIRIGILCPMRALNTVVLEAGCDMSPSRVFFPYTSGLNATALADHLET